MGKLPHSTQISRSRKYEVLIAKDEVPSPGKPGKAKEGVVIWWFQVFFRFFIFEGAGKRGVEFRNFEGVEKGGWEFRSLGPGAAPQFSDWHDLWEELV